MRISASSFVHHQSLSGWASDELEGTFLLCNLDVNFRSIIGENRIKSMLSMRFKYKITNIRSRHYKNYLFPSS
jgi:hypothetical protein